MFWTRCTLAFEAKNASFTTAWTQPPLSCQNGQTWVPLASPSLHGHRAPSCMASTGVWAFTTLQFPSHYATQRALAAQRQVFCVLFLAILSSGLGLNPRTQPLTTIGTFRRRGRGMGPPLGLLLPSKRVSLPCIQNNNRVICKWTHI